MHCQHTQFDDKTSWNMKAAWSADDNIEIMVFFGEEKENDCKKQSTGGKSLKKKPATKAHFTKRGDHHAQTSNWLEESAPGASEHASKLARIPNC